MNPFASLLCCSEIQDTWRSNGFFFFSNGFFLPPVAHTLGIWVGQGCCLSSGPLCHPAFPPLLHKLHPMLSSDRPPHSVPGSCGQNSAQVGSPAGMLSLLSTFELCQPSQVTSRNFLGISLSSPPAPSPTTASATEVKTRSNCQNCDPESFLRKPKGSKG